MKSYKKNTVEYVLLRRMRWNMYYVRNKFTSNRASEVLPTHRFYRVDELKQFYTLCYLFTNLGCP